MSGEAAKLEYTTHAVHVMTESWKDRQEPVAWVEWVIDEPALRVPDPNEPVGRALFFRSICAEQNDRILRVAVADGVRSSVAPWRVVSVFFDRA